MKLQLVFVYRGVDNTWEFWRRSLKNLMF